MTVKTGYFWKSLKRNLEYYGQKGEKICEMTVKPEKRCKNMENITVKSNAEYKFDRNGAKGWKFYWEMKKRSGWSGIVSKLALPNRKFSRNKRLSIVIMYRKTEEGSYE